jgi:hypothetical protein
MKSLAIAASAGVAIGICATTTSRRAPARRQVTGNGTSGRHEVSSDSLIDIEPLLSRLEAMERRFEAASGPLPMVNVTELTRRIDAQDAELQRLRALVDDRGSTIQSQLEAEMEEQHRRSFAALEQKVEIAIADRIAAVERRLMEHSESINDLRARAQDTDANLKRLILAIEKLVDRTQTIPQAPASVAPSPPPLPVVGPFEAQLNEARRKDEEIVKINSRTGIFKEEEPRKPRFPMARIFGMLALVAMVGAFSPVLG